MMQGSSVRLISDISALADVADVVSDPVKLKALRDELNSNLKINQESDKQLQAKLDQLKALDITVTTSKLSLDSKKSELDAVETNLLKQKDSHDKSLKDLAKAQTELVNAQKKLDQDKL